MHYTFYEQVQFSLSKVSNKLVSSVRSLSKKWKEIPSYLNVKTTDCSHITSYHNNIACLDCNKFVLLNTMINLLILLLHLSASIHHQDKQRVLVLVFSNSNSCLILCAKYKKLHKLEKHKKRFREACWP